MALSKILIVEDEIEFANMMKIRLELSGYKITMATDTQSGVDAVFNEEFNLLILDLMMPGGGGFALLEQIKDYREKRPLPVVFVTGKTITSEVQAMIGAFQVSALFTKPYDPAEFIQTIKSLAQISD
ncbi:response regulator transcription factor [candidate division KSB1 bacterium]|nr:response regulator transcription factor [candidate division KSB1 bacterium]